VERRKLMCAGIQLIPQLKPYGKTGIKLLMFWAGSQIKQLQKTEWSDMDKELLKWFNQKRSENVWVSRYHLMDKTKELAELLNDKDFVCING
jgi:hypothetical protein